MATITSLSWTSSPVTVQTEHLDVVASDTLEDLRHIEDPFAELVSNPEFNKDLLEEIRCLRQNVIDVKTGFGTVRADLHRFDRQGFVDQNNKPLRLCDEWVKYEKKFLQLINRSQSMATRAATVLEDIAWTVLDPEDKTSDVNCVLQELQNLIKRVRKEEQAAGNLEVEFTTLSNEVQAYANQITTTAKNVRCDQSEVVEGMRKLLNAARDSLAKTRAKMKSLMTTTVLSAVLGSGMLVLACLLCPAIAVPAFATIVHGSKTGVKFMDAMNLAQKQQQIVNELTTQLKKEEEKFEWIDQYLGRMSHTERIIEDMSTKLSAISQVWHLIQQDLVRLTEQIESLVPEDQREMKFERFWDRRMTRCRNSVDALIPMLKAYARAVDKV